MNQDEPDAAVDQDEWSFEISGEIGANCVTPPANDGHQTAP